jgi:RHS repeat-associated protein
VDRRPALYWWLTLSIAILGSSLPGFAQSPTPHFENALWIAETGGLLKVATADGDLLFEISGLGEVRAVAVDDRRGMVWLYAERTLRAYGFDGEAQLSIPVSSPNSAHAALTVNAEDGSVWLGTGKDLWSFSASGQLLHSLRLASNIETLSADGANGRLWVGTANDVVARDLPSAAPLQALELGAQPAVNDLSVDPATGEVWVALRDGVRRFNLAGQLLSSTPTRDVRRVAATEGGAWAATTKDLLKITASGSIALALRPFSGNGAISELAADSSDGSIWLANNKDVVQVSGAGQRLRYLEFQPPLHIWDLALYTDLIPPEVEIMSPTAGSYLNTHRPVLELRVSDVGSGFDPATLAVQANGVAIAVTCTFRPDGGSCALATELSDGPTTLTATIKGYAGNISAPAEVSFTVDTVPPEVRLTAPTDGMLTNQAQVTFAGSLSEPAALAINGQPVVVAADLSFSSVVTLQEGTNPFSLVATDRAGNAGTRSLTVIRDTTPPPPVDATHVAVSQPANGHVTLTGAAGAAEPSTTVTITNTRTGGVVSAPVGADGSFTASLGAEARDVLSIVAADAAGNQSSPATVTVPGPPPGGGLPPDPVTVATPIDPTVVTDIATATEFLYAGPQPVQNGVAPGTIDPYRVAVLRGKVTDQEGGPLAGVEVTVLGHPELGSTRTREDGFFDLAVNGGGALVLAYQKEGFFPAQRGVDAPWRDFAWMEEVVLVRPDPAAVTITSGAPSIQVARGSLSSDEDGTRRATLLFQPSTNAEMVMGDGSHRPLAALTVRATEYTVGPRGPAAMPGPLPSGVAYTHAVELSADEAIAAGAKSVVFSRPVIYYLENFLGFPVGGLVPVGYYDRDLGSWLPSDNGRVVKILSVTDGGAALDITGSGTPADAAALAALGVTEDERRQLASLYSPGQSLWRVPISHFTPWDCNWPYGPPPDAKPPGQPEPDIDDPEDDSCKLPGSIIECQNQTLGESLPVAGTLLTLNYRSDRVPGRKGNLSIGIPLSGPSVPSSLKRIELKIAIAGQLFVSTFSREPNQRYIFTWDGKDAYGRTLSGRQFVTVEIGYVYGLAVYQSPSSFQQSWARLSGVPLTGIETRQEITLWQRSRRQIGSWSIPPTDLGGWSLSPHHYYDEGGSYLFLGNGDRAHAGPSTQAIATVAGQLAGSSRGDGGPATAARLVSPQGIDIGPDGSIYIADVSDRRVRKVTPDGTIRTFAGGGSSGSGFPAAQARLFNPYDVAAAPDGSVYIADYDAIKKVDPNGIISIVYIHYTTFNSIVYGIDVDHEGNLYIADYGRNQIVRLDRSGRETIVAGTGSFGYTGDGGPALQANLANLYDVAVDRQGNVYFTTSKSVRKVSPSGIINTITGLGNFCSHAGDGGPATLAPLCEPRGLATGPDGSLYIADPFVNRIRRVSPEGVMTTVAGSGVWGFNGDGGSATAAQLMAPVGVAVGPNGLVHVTDQSARVRKVGFALPGYSLQPVVTVAARSSRELFFFNNSGRHLKTVDTLTGHTVNEFSYDAAGRLSSVRDANGEVTQIERNASGQAIAVVSAYGVRTELTSDANGYLASIRNPAGETVRLTHDAEGLLASMTDPRNGRYEFSYDALGRLASDKDPAGGIQRLTRTATANGFRIDLTSAEQRTRGYTVDELSTGDRQWILRSPSGTQSFTLFKTNGTRQTTRPDGTVVTEVRGPDPRFGLQSPVTSSLQIRTPSGLTSSSTRTVSAILGSPSDPLSLRTLSETDVQNGRTFSRIFDASLRRFTTTSAEGRQRSVTVDAQGRPIQGSVLGLLPVTFQYDTRGRVADIRQGTGAAERRVVLAYDALGRVASTTDHLGRVRTMSYDAAGRVIAQQLEDGRSVAYQYDEDGNLVSVTPPGRAPHLFEYTAVALPSSYAPPAVPGVTEATTYTYNLDRQLSRITRPGGELVSFQYDAAGRLAQMTLPEGDYRYERSPTTGHLSSIAAPSGEVVSFTYDGSLPTRSAWTGPVSGSIERSYDNNFWIKSESVNGTNPVAFSYDRDGLLKSAGMLSISREAASGRVSGTTLGGVTTSSGYDSFGELATFSASFQGAQIARFEYQRDTVGRIVTATETIAGTTRMLTYTYDTAKRLATVDLDGSRLAAYTFDTNGNRTSVVSPTGSTSAVFDAQDRLQQQGDEAFTYRPSGELLSRTQNGQQIQYSYDALWNLRKVVLPDGITIEYVIDGRNRRVGKKVDGVLVKGWLFGSQLRPLAELDGAGAVRARFVYGVNPGAPDLMFAGGVTYRLITDQLGSVRLVLNAATGEVAQRLDYDAFGVVVNDTRPGFQPFGFAGGLYDYQTGLVRFGARDYDAGRGRWTTKDPSLFAGNDTNLYGYAFSDPVNFVDVDGKSAGVIVLGAAGFLFAVSAVLATPQGQEWVRDAVRDLIQPHPALPPPIFDRKLRPYEKPDNCPPGTIPIDQFPGLGKDAIHEIKDGIRARPTDWVGIDPNGNVIAGDEDGNAENYGPFNSYFP